MSNRPVARIVARNSKTGVYTDVGTVWPCRFAEDDGTVLGLSRGITFGSKGNRDPKYDVSPEDIALLLKDPDVYFDLRAPHPPKEAEGSETAEEFD